MIAGSLNLIILKIIYLLGNVVNIEQIEAGL